MLDELFSKDRRLRISHKSILESGYANKRLVEIIDRYLDRFSSYYNLTSSDILSCYDKFANEYLANINNFIATGKYPFELGKDVNFDRLDYDVCLILSPVITEYRHRILSNFLEYCSTANGEILIIGVGSGVELEIITNILKSPKLEIYDLNISNFVKERFKHFEINESEFTGSEHLYDNIIAIELLEHLSDPFGFVSMCARFIQPHGKFVVTTATNIPHIDHLYNFTNASEFEDKVKECGLCVQGKEMIKNNYFSKDIDAMNTWYVLEKLK